VVLAASHPEWTPANRGPEGWGPEVSSYAIDDGERLLLIDPLAPPSEIDELAASRDPVVVLTCPWHERDARSLVERLGAPVFVPPPDEGNDGSGSRAAGRSSSATRSSTSAAVSSSQPTGAPRA